jgi:Txe/YoeB family toxin of Txe-Axe toxin-antitoxin module
MNIEFTEIAWEDFSYWIENDEDVVLKIKELIHANTKILLKEVLFKIKSVKRRSCRTRNKFL